MTAKTKHGMTASKAAVTSAMDIVAEMKRDGFAVLPGFKPRAGHIYTRTRAISARINQNFDGFPSEELKRAYKTFLGKPCFVNHANEDPTRARGRVVAALYVENGDDKYVDVIQEVNALKFPKLAHELTTGGLDAVSMGCSAERTICSYCGNVARGMFDMCDHVLNHKGQRLSRRNPDGTVESVLVYEECRDLGFFELSYVFDPADETALVSNVLVASKTAARSNKARYYCDLPGCRRWTVPDTEGWEQWVHPGGEQRAFDFCCDGHFEQYKRKYPQWAHEAGVRNPLKTAFRRRRRKLGYGEIEAPASVDTLRPESDADTDDFHHYVESPDILSDPDLTKAKDLDRRDEMGLSQNQGEENAEALDPLSTDLGGEVDADPDAGQEPVTDIDGEQAAPFDPNAEDDEQAPFDPDAPDEDEAPFDPDAPADGQIVDEQTPDDPQLDPQQQVPEQDLAQERADNAQALEHADAVDEHGNPIVVPDKDPLAIGSPPEDPDAQRLDPEKGIAPPEPDQVIEEEFAEDADPMEDEMPDEKQTPADQRRERPRATDQKKRRTEGSNRAVSRRKEQDTLVRKEHVMGKDSLAARGRVASRTRVAEDKSRNDQGEWEEVFITQTPPEEPVETAEGEDISNTENNLVALRQRRKMEHAALLEQRARQLRAEAQGEIPNETAQPDERIDMWESVEETQPKGASRKAMTLPQRHRHFAHWVRQTQGKGLREASSRSELLRWASTYGKRAGLGVRDMYPIVQREVTALDARIAERKTAGEVPEAFKEQWNKGGDSNSDDGGSDESATKNFLENPGDADKKESRRRKTADEKLDVAAPDGRVDVEAPTRDTTDEDAQEGQFDSGEFADNAGDNLADPDLSTDQNWLPGEGKRSSAVKTADGLSAVRLAEAYVTAGLDTENEGRWNLANKFAKMSATTVATQTTLLERVIEVNGLGAKTAQNKTAGSRGAARVRSAVPPNLTHQMPPAQTREAAADAGGNADYDLFM